MGNTIEQIKEEIEKEKGFESWYSLYRSCIFKISTFEIFCNQVAIRYAQQFKGKDFNI